IIICDKSIDAQEYIPLLVQELDFFARQRPGVERSKTGPYFNIGLFLIFQPRVFGAAKKPILELRGVYMNLFFSNIMTSHFPEMTNCFFWQPTTPPREKKEVKSLDELIEEANRLDKKIKELRDRIDKIDDDFNNSLVVRLVGIFFNVKVSKSS